MQRRLLHDDAKQLGIRIIAVSRPGVGASLPQCGRRLIDWPPLVRELAAALALPRFHLLGVSGGGPYALAAAWGLADLTEGVAVVCGAPPVAEIGSARGFNFAYRAMLGTHRHLPSVMRAMFRLLHPLTRVKPPAWLMVLLRGFLVGPDKATLSDPAIAQMCSEGFRGAWGEYRDGVFEDAELYTQPWGFPIEDIRVPLRVWHGTEDQNFFPSVAEYARRIPGGNLRIVEGEGHYSLPSAARGTFSPTSSPLPAQRSRPWSEVAIPKPWNSSLASSPSLITI